ncbi:hypothetical protein SAMN05880501_10689 [Ureibacillus xyleni]|uniref:Uncharacterized protein n=1 Tax=Ureibacillus xyleni TaxID=614648 RepID=A0A285SXD9_9BACL|nr:transposase [Ureibacillus xyleni]SOC11134.1 hypothetical protein SAMN05880501_10689 [Ureibacillus xyleni]
MKNENNKQIKDTEEERKIKALKAEIERLEMENAYLKKLNALVQEKSRKNRI